MKTTNEKAAGQTAADPKYPTTDFSKSSQAWKASRTARGYTANAMERNFRRGMAHGAWFAAEAAKAGTTPPELREWALAVLDWRNSLKDSEFVMPPAFKKAGAK